MSSDDSLKPQDSPAPTGSEPARVLTPAAERALKEAAERRAAYEKAVLEHKRATELGGRAGPDPVRYGDWENGGIASDF